MKCNPENVLLHFLNELDTEAAGRMKRHLRSCERCRKELEDLRRLKAVLPEEPQWNPAAARMNRLRNEMDRRIRAGSAMRAMPFPFSFIHPRPVFQAGFAAVLLFMGFFVGRLSREGGLKTGSPREWFAAGKAMELVNGAFDASGAGIDRIRFDTQTGVIEVEYNSANTVRFGQSLSDPGVKPVLLHAMLQAQDPRTRLHAVKALSALSENRPVDADFVGGLHHLLRQETQSGIKRMALKILGRAPLQESVKQILMDVLAYDRDNSVRIEAFKTLASQNPDPEEILPILHVAARDSSDYIRYRALEMLEARETESKREAI
ncbi:HEAT repeat domain-containing protein [bacterium]|nr:HEAT repeat domain-containing protein [bacterium]